MSGIKQEILDLLILNGRKPQTIKSGERVVYLYDALNIVNKEFSKTEQPQLNENQQIVLDWLKANVEQDNASPMCSVFLLGEWQTRIGSKEFRNIDIAYCNLDSKQQAQVLEVFSRWALEQEEE